MAVQPFPLNVICILLPLKFTGEFELTMYLGFMSRMGILIRKMIDFSLLLQSVFY